MAHGPEVKTSDELTFLRYFYRNVDGALGPGSDDVYYAIKRNYVADTGNRIPRDYRDE